MRRMTFLAEESFSQNAISQNISVNYKNKAVSKTNISMNQIIACILLSNELWLLMDYN